MRSLFPITPAATLQMTAMMSVNQMRTPISLSHSLPSDRFPKRKFTKGSFIKQSDSQSENIYLIESGKVVTYFLGPQGQDVPIIELWPGDFVGDLSAFGYEEPGTYFQAIEDTSVIVLSQSQFLEDLRTIPAFAEFVAKTLYSRLRTMKRLYIENNLLPMKMRLYAELIRNSVRDPEGRLCISPVPTHAELARRISSQRETVTKQISRLTKMGVIDGSRGLITITDEAYLRAEIDKALGSTG